MTEFSLSRRGFLKAAIAGAAVAATTSPAFALIKDEFIAKVEKLIRLHDELIEMTEIKDLLADKPNVTCMKRVLKQDFTKDQYDAKFNEVVEHATTFDVPAKGTPEFEAALADTNKVFDRDNKNSFRDLPPTLCPAAIAISAVRSLLAIHKLKIDPTNMPAFIKFSDMYIDLILGA